MPSNDELLKYGLLAGTGYFVAMSAAHFVGFKRPLLFIYYDVPSKPYQDKIISFCAATYALLFHRASQDRGTVPTAIAALGATVVGLSAVNASGDLAAEAKGSKQAYWIQTGLIAGYLAALAGLYYK